MDRKIKRAVRTSPKPMPVEYLLSNSGVLRRSAMEEYARQRQDATKAISFFNRERFVGFVGTQYHMIERHRRRMNTQIDAEQRTVLNSDNLREYATNLARGYSQNHD